jgi:predicted RNA-binding Zn-ribbon protein involved in translation (DUF1610 family)
MPHFEMPSHCIDCGALLEGGRTKHTVDCSIGQLIRTVQRGAEYVCPQCGFASFNPNDRINSYCVRCHKFMEDA